MVIFEDIGNKENKHNLKHLQWESTGILWERIPLPCGDYILSNEKVLDVIARKEKRDIPPKKMDFLGTYNVCVDTKKDMQEIAGNICGNQHQRFRDECILAQNNNIKLYILIENMDGIKTIDDVFKWHNPRLDIYVPDKSNVIGYYKNGLPRYSKKQKYPKATRGTQLAKSMLSMQIKYGVEFLFCNPSESSSKIIELLTKE